MFASRCTVKDYLKTHKRYNLVEEMDNYIKIRFPMVVRPQQLLRSISLDYIVSSRLTVFAGFFVIVISVHDKLKGCLDCILFLFYKDYGFVMFIILFTIINIHPYGNADFYSMF